MKIYSMTATFGKLEHQTLTLQPGMNIIEAPNEWGKSTWSAFVVAMLYGIDTRERTTQTALADKERYAPWSGAPMEGKMELNWNGRDITIERRTKGRLIFGEFRAYETDSGLDVPELTASNCGMELLGVERSVFVRAGFLKLSDMPVTQDDALRRRLNNLVTTGDESGAGEKLAQALKDLKNKCQSNKRNGLIPQAEAEREKLMEQLDTLQELNHQAQRLQERQRELDTWIAQLENHKTALRYAQAQEDSKHLQEELSRQEATLAQLEQQKIACEGLPSLKEAERMQGSLQKLHNESMSLQMEQQMLPLAPEKPTAPRAFEGLTGPQAITQAQEDAAKLQGADKKSALSGIGIGLLILGILAAAAGFVLLQWQTVCLATGGAVAGLGLLLLVIGILKTQKNKASKDALEKKYDMPVDSWLAAAQSYAQEQENYEKAMAEHRQEVAELNRRREELLAQLQELTAGEPLPICLEKWDKIVGQWKTLADMQRDAQRAESQLTALQTMKQEVPAPKWTDNLTQSMSETDSLLTNAAFEQKQNQLRLGQFQGQAEAMGQESALRAQLKAVRSRIQRLEETYQALEIAQKALSAAINELQRRFAPRIAKRAQELFSCFTGGRYEKMMLAEDLSVHVSAQQEATVRPSQWRSDGTVDQLYLALRLAVAEELTPEAPLILDDALVRFDDKRLATALHTLQEMAEHKQVILFTCQGREKQLQGEA